MFKFNPYLISKIVAKKGFLISCLAVTLILTGILHTCTIASSATSNPDFAINQKVYAQELIAQSEISTSDTALLFQNDRYAVRVFREGDQAYLNIYDKASQTQKLNKVPVSITPADNPKKDQTKYIATIGDQQFTVTINPQGFSQLIILQGGTVVYEQVSNRIEIARKVPGISEQAEPPNPTRELIRTLFSNYAKLTLFALMFSMGLNWTLVDVVWLWKQPSLLLRSLFSVFIAVPLLGVLVTFIPGLTVPERIGIGAMMVCPGAPAIPLKSLKAGGNADFVASLQFAVCTLAIISIPLTALILAQFYPNHAWLSPQEIAKQIFSAQLLPMGIGVLLAHYLPKLADDLVEPITKIAQFLLLLLVIVLLVVNLDQVINAGLPAYLAIALMSIGSLVCGHFLGGPQPDTQTVLAYATVSRNAGLAVLLISLNFPNLDYVKGGILNTVITYILIAAIVSIPYTTWRKKTMNSLKTDDSEAIK
ncbi:MAG: hypothetical protein WBV73_19320 [Phormidium sp.]